MEGLTHMRFCHKNIKHYVILRLNEAVATRGREKKPRKIVIFHSTKSNKQRLGRLTFGFAGKVFDIFLYPTVKREDLCGSLCFLPGKKSKPRSDLSRELLAKNFNNLFCDYGNEMRGLSWTWKRFIWLDLKNSEGGFETCQSQNHSSSVFFSCDAVLSFMRHASCVKRERKFERMPAIPLCKLQIYIFILSTSFFLASRWINGFLQPPNPTSNLIPPTRKTFLPLPFTESRMTFAEFFGKINSEVWVFLIKNPWLRIWKYSSAFVINNRQRQREKLNFPSTFPSI